MWDAESYVNQAAPGAKMEEAQSSIFSQIVNFPWNRREFLQPGKIEEIIVVRMFQVWYLNILPKHIISSKLEIEHLIATERGVPCCN